MKTVDQIQLSIPAEIHQQLKNKAERDNKAVEEFILEIITKEVNSSKDKIQVYCESDEEKVKERLRSLGYLD